MTARDLAARTDALPLVLEGDDRCFALPKGPLHRLLDGIGKGVLHAAGRAANAIQGLQRIGRRGGQFGEGGDQQPFGRQQPGLHFQHMARHFAHGPFFIGHPDPSGLSQVGDDAESAGPGNRPADEAEAGQ